MTSEFFQRHKAGILLFFYAVIAVICLSNRVDPYVVGLKSSLWFLIKPEVVNTGQFFNKLDSIRGRFFDLVRAEGENHLLRQQNAQLAKKDVEQAALQVENNRLRNLLGLKGRVFPASIPAEVVAHDVQDWFYSVTINKGEEDNVLLSAAVVAGTPDRPALVGRVVELDRTTSRVLLITDPLSAVSVSLASKGDLGLLEGQNKPTVVVRYLPYRSRVAVGDEVLTVGLGGVFPPGVPVGKVIDVSETQDGFFKQALVQPYLDFGSLQEVLILKRHDKPTVETSS